MRLVLSLLLALSAAGAAAQAQLAVTVEARAVAPAATRGFSSVNLRFDATYWVLAGDGLAFHHLYIDWQRGRAGVLDTESLPEPAHAMQVMEGTAWFAGAGALSLVETDLHGRTLGRYATLVDGTAVTSALVRRGFGGLAASHDRRLLYAAFEGPLWTPEGWEAMPDGRAYARVLEFDLATQRWTGRSLRYALEAQGNALADLRFVDARTALVLERGAGFQRIYRVAVGADEMAKAAFVDLAPAKLADADGMEIVEPGYIVLTSTKSRELVLLRSADLLFPLFERSRP